MDSAIKAAATPGTSTINAGITPQTSPPPAAPPRLWCPRHPRPALLPYLSWLLVSATSSTRLAVVPLLATPPSPCPRRPRPGGRPQPGALPYLRCHHPVWPHGISRPVDVIMSDRTPLPGLNSLGTPYTAVSNKENVNNIDSANIDSAIGSSQLTVLRPPLQSLLNANAIDTASLMRSGLNNGAQRRYTSLG